MVVEGKKMEGMAIVRVVRISDLRSLVVGVESAVARCQNLSSTEGIEIKRWTG